MKIAMLVSGGVDSSVAAAKLVDDGHDVHAFYLKIWLEDELSYLGDCPWEEDLDYAQRVCDQLKIPLTVVPLQKEYHERVVRYTINAVKAGLTPNPDMMCNREVKFGAFADWLDKEKLQFDKIATGHYAWVENGKMYRAPDLVKDQTYFLAMMHPAQIARALFPIGQMEKVDVRAEAEKRDLPTAARKDSQGICFLGKISFTDFLKHHLGTRRGKFIEKETGTERGEHEGFFLYTIGQRRGVDINGGPWYVCDKDADKNIVYLTHGFAGDDQRKDSFIVTHMNWLDTPATKELHVKLRHGPQMYKCTIDVQKDAMVHVQLSEKDQGITPGQYAVFYDGAQCLGGGVIS